MRSHFPSLFTLNGKTTKVLIFHSISFIFLIIYFCEFLIYYVVIKQCNWPELQETNSDSSFQTNKSTKGVKALFIADIHLLGKRKGHWLDKLRREWQMQKAFQTAIILFEPEVVFVLGDLFDDGVECNDDEFEYYVKKLHLLFQVKANIKMYFVVGNHDIGYHYDTSDDLHKRFMTALNAPSVQLVSIRGNYFILINSMALEGDGCFLCRPAQLELNRIAKQLRCLKGIGKCSQNTTFNQYSRPILLQHFPMYREYDKNCFESDDTPEHEKKQDFYEGWDCLSKEASEMIYDFFEPRVIVDGHTHHGCHILHRKDIHEYTVTSFNWRFKNSPSFLMGVFLPNNYSINKCHIPQESTVILLYSLGFFGVTIYVTVSIWLTKTQHRIHWKFA